MDPFCSRRWKAQWRPRLPSRGIALVRQHCVDCAPLCAASLAASALTGWYWQGGSNLVDGTNHPLNCSHPSSIIRLRLLLPPSLRHTVEAKAGPKAVLFAITVTAVLPPPKRTLCVAAFLGSIGFNRLMFQVEWRHGLPFGLTTKRSAVPPFNLQHQPD